MALLLTTARWTIPTVSSVVNPGIRAVKTVAQTAVALIGTSTVMNEVNWAMIISASCLSGVVSILTSVAGLPELEEIESE